MWGRIEAAEGDGPLRLLGEWSCEIESRRKQWLKIAGKENIKQDCVRATGEYRGGRARKEGRKEKKEGVKRRLYGTWKGRRRTKKGKMANKEKENTHKEEERPKEAEEEK